MSSEAAPISPTRFAEALKDLSAENLALKVFELRNSIAHLDYSNAELRPYAEGLASVIDTSSPSNNTSPSATTTTQSSAQTTTTTTTTTAPGQVKGDQDCIDAIAENQIVIARMLERIDLIKTEVESRGLSWRELSGRLPDADDTTVGVVPQSAVDTTTSNTTTTAAGNGATNGTMNGTATANGVPNGISSGSATAAAGGQEGGQRHSAWTDGTFQTGTIRTGGAGLSDEELLRRLQEQIPGLGDEDDEGGMHL